MGYDYQQERTFNILDKAASNEGGAASIMNAGMGLGMGINIGGIVGGAMGNAAKNIANNNIQSISNEKIKCSKCGVEVPVNSKFCLECGNKIETLNIQEKIVKCPKCNAYVPEGRFCLECGNEFITKCFKCGANLIPGAKFCLECGNKIE